MLAFLCSIFLIVLEVLCCKIFMESFLEKKSDLKPQNEIFLLVVLIGIIFLSVCFFENNFLYKEIIVVLVNVFVWKQYFQARFINISAGCILFLGVALLQDYLCVVILCKLFPSISLAMNEELWINILVSLLSKMILFGIVLIIKKWFGTQNSAILTDKEWIRFSIIPVFTIISMVAIITNWQLVASEKQIEILICISVGLVAMNLFIFYIINDIMNRELKIREYSVLQEKVKNEINTYHSITENYEQQKKRAHEFKNQITCIGELVRQGCYQELIEYLEQIEYEIEKTNQVDTNNIIVNAIINSKMRDGKKKGILFIVKTNDLSNIRLRDEDVVTVLSNLLDNAIEANELCKNKWIKLKFMKEDNKLVIAVVNAMGKKPTKENGKFISSKLEDKDMHGIGIENIVSVVQKYEGSYVIRIDDSEFGFTIIIPND